MDLDPGSHGSHRDSCTDDVAWPHLGVGGKHPACVQTLAIVERVANPPAEGSDLLREALVQLGDRRQVLESVHGGHDSPRDAPVRCIITTANQYSLVVRNMEPFGA